MRRHTSSIVLTLLLVLSAVCPLVAGLLFLLAAGVGLIDIDL